MAMKPAILKLIILLVLFAVVMFHEPPANAISSNKTREANAAKQEPRLVIESGGHLAVIRRLIVTADGRELVSASDDKTIRVWSV